VISNGFADVTAIGIDGHFEAVISAHEVGCAKPDPKIYAAFAQRMQLDPGEILYVGDDPANDVVGPIQSGLKAAWVNRHGHAWPDEHAAAGEPRQFRDLGEFADWMLAQ
jgi:putative hydrolase of the HAD superfamily